jgi:hypothetical protein
MRIINETKVKLEDVLPGEVFTHQGLTYMCIVNSTGRTISDVNPRKTELAVDLSTGELAILSPEDMVEHFPKAHMIIE